MNKVYDVYNHSEYDMEDASYDNSNGPVEYAENILIQKDEA